jgi:hypothetical protein
VTGAGNNLGSGSTGASDAGSSGDGDTGGLTGGGGSEGGASQFRTPSHASKILRRFGSAPAPETAAVPGCVTRAGK